MVVREQGWESNRLGFKPWFLWEPGYHIRPMSPTQRLCPPLIPGTVRTIRFKLQSASQRCKLTASCYGPLMPTCSKYLSQDFSDTSVGDPSGNSLGTQKCAV